MRNERGIAMLIALIVAVLLSLLCLSLTFSSIKEFQVSSEFENHEQALLVADAGFGTIKQSLRGKDLDTLLARTTYVYAPTADPSHTLTWWAIRNPIPPYQARNVDFATSSGGTGTLVRGLLTPGAGVTVGDCSGGKPCGRYFAKLSDNFEGDGDPYADSDGTVYLRVIGVKSGFRSESGANKNAVAVIETVLHREMSFDMSAPFSLISKQVSANFDGNSFKIDGYDHSGMTIAQLNGGHNDNNLTPFTAISCLYDNPGLGDATAAVNNVRNALTTNQYNNVIGEGSPSIEDETIEVKNSGNPDSANVFSAAYLLRIANQLSAIADYKYPTGTDTSTKFAGGDVFGTPAAPKITYVKGDLDIQGNCGGAGLLVVTGDMSGNGGFEFEGLVLVLGKGSVSFGGANKTIVGGIVIANLQSGPPASFGDASIDIRGRSEFYFAGDRIRLATSLMTMRTMSWREITPEIEPASYSYWP